jgi:hypothetical protein
VDDQVRLQGLLQGGGERLHELVGKLADEADGVGREVVAARDLERPRGGVEGVEEALADADVRASQRVEQRRLAGVGVPGERDRRQPGALALPAHHPTGALLVVEPAPELGDPVAGQAAVGLDL